MNTFFFLLSQMSLRLGGKLNLGIIATLSLPSKVELSKRLFFCQARFNAQLPITRRRRAEGGRRTYFTTKFIF